MAVTINKKYEGEFSALIYETGGGYYHMFASSSPELDERIPKQRELGMNVLARYDGINLKANEPIEHALKELKSGNPIDFDTLLE